MSTRVQTFQKCAAAVDTLGTYFGDQREALFDEESPSQYKFSTEVEGIAWLKKNLSPLAASLLPARFRLRLTVTAHDFQAELRVHGDAAKLEVDCENTRSLEEELLGPLPTEVIEAFETFQQTLRTRGAGLPIGDVYNLLETLAAGGVTVGLSLHLFLDKNWINRRLGTAVKENAPPKVASFLFPEAFIRTLRQISLASFEEEFCQFGQRTVIPIFGFSGCLHTDVLAICGRGHESKLDALLTEPLSNEGLQKTQETLAFRKSQSSGEVPTKWLTPDAFALAVELPADDDTGTELCRQLKSFQALLSAMFLADYVEFSDDKFWVEYKGFGRVRLPVERASLLEHEPHLESLYRLYAYAYEGFSADKLEIAQQFLSLLAVDLGALCGKAIEVRDATKKTYERVLVEKVRDYFDARHKIQERIKTAISETSSSVISLTRDVSADLYKIAGVIAGAVIGALLKPELSLWAAFGASSVIAVYMGLVVFYHLATLKQSCDLRMMQHAAYIQSFQDVLRTEEIQGFLGDEHLGKAQAVFSGKCKWATVIYVVFLIVALAVAVVCMYMLFCAVPSTSTSSVTPTATP